MAAEQPKLTRVIWRALWRGIFWLLLIFLIIVTSIKWINPPGSAVIWQHNLSAWLEQKPSMNQRWVTWDEISPYLALAVISSEDQRFPVHHGIDFTELGKVIRSGDKRGASTITQQVAKNMFLWQGRSYVRKALEAAIALYIDLVWGKQRVLEVYLNIAYFGENQFGVSAAGKRFFNKHPKDINRFEAARLAAVLPSPQRFSARNASPYIVERQQWILKQMQSLGGLGYIKSLSP